MGGDVMGNLSTNFDLDEFFSPNDKGRTWKAKAPKPELVLTLEAIRAAAGKPVHIESGIRSVEHNAKLKGSSKNSAHLTGEAADIWVDGVNNKQLGSVIRTLHAQGKLPHLAYSYLIKGTSNTRVHVGVDKYVKRRSVWGPGYHV
jgi:hypothetical protein